MANKATFRLCYHCSMDSEQLFPETTTTTDVTTLLPDFTESLSDTLAPIIWLSVALTVVFVVLYVVSIVRRRKLEHALLDIQKTLNEMNERDKQRTQPPTPASTPPPDRNRVIAATDTTTEE